MEKILLVGIAALTLCLPANAAAQGQSIATYNVLYYNNASGCGPGAPNPFDCSYLSGPILVDPTLTPPGDYRVDVLADLDPGNIVGGFRIWDGDAAAGTQYLPGDIIHHTSGQDYLYAWDWYPWDNPPGSGWVVAVYALSSPHLTIVLDQPATNPSPASSVHFLDEVTATLTDQSGQAMSTQPVNFQASVSDLTGAGHAHTNFTADLPGDFVDDTGLTNSSCTTDQNGQCHVNYVIPEVSGTFTITATFQAVTAPPQTVNVQVGGLVPLGPGVGFDSTAPAGGQTSRHPLNHFGTPLLAGAIIPALASDYVFQNQGVLGINDMSLKRGGLFDLDGVWDNAAGHNLHRYGTSVDINRTQVNGQTIDQNTLDALARSHGLIRIPEPEGSRCPINPPFTPCIHYEVYP